MIDNDGNVGELCLVKVKYPLTGRGSFFYRCLLMIDQVGEVGELNHYELTELVGKVGKGFWFRY